MLLKLKKLADRDLTVHGKRAIVEPDRLLSAQEVMERVHTVMDVVLTHLAISKKAA